MSCGPRLQRAVLQQQQPLVLREGRAGLSLFPWPLGAERLSGSSREPELPREHASLWSVSALKGLCCFQCGVRSLFFFWRERKVGSVSGILGCGMCFNVSAFFGSSNVLLGFSCPHFNTGRYTQLISCRTCRFSPFSCAGKKESEGWLV